MRVHDSRAPGGVVSMLIGRDTLARKARRDRHYLECGDALPARVPSLRGSAPHPRDAVFPAGPSRVAQR